MAPNTPETPPEDRGATSDRPVVRQPTPAIGHGPEAPARPVSLDPAPVPVVEPTGPTASGQKITAFGKPSRHEQAWARTPNTTGTGAIHVKTFHAKLTEDALTYMDQCINEWLDSHPQYEVKFVTASVGTVTGKVKEPNLICQVWV